MKLSSVIASTVLAVSAEAYVTTGSRVQKREVVENPPTLMMTHLSPITVEGGGLDDPDIIYDLDVNTEIAGDVFLTEIPMVRDIEESGPGPENGGIAMAYYRRIFASDSMLGTVTVRPQEEQEEIELPGGRVVDTSLSCYFLTKTDGSEFDSPSGELPSNVRYIDSEESLFYKSEPFALGTPTDTDRSYDGIECE